MISSQFALSALPPWLKRNSLGRKDCGPSIPHRNRRAGRVQAGGFVNLFHLCYPPVWLHQPSTPPPIHFLRLSSSITLSGLVAPTGLINLGFDERRVWSNILEVPNELTDGPLHIITIWHSQWLVFSGITTTECMLVGYTGILMTQESVCGMVWLATERFKWKFSMNPSVNFIYRAYVCNKTALPHTQQPPNTSTDVSRCGGWFWSTGSACLGINQTD